MAPLATPISRPWRRSSTRPTAASPASRWTGPSAATGSRSDAARAGRLRRAREPRSGGPRDRAGRQRLRLLRRLRPGRLRRGRHGAASRSAARRRPGSPLDPAVQARNHDPDGTWDPVVDFQMMCAQRARLHEPLPLRQAGRLQGPRLLRRRRHRHGALLRPAGVAEDAKIGYPPARVWGVPTTALWAYRIGPARAKRLLLTGDSIDGTEAVEWGLATEAAPAAELDERFEALLERIARLPVNQLVMHKLLVNQAALRAGPARDPGARHLLRRHRPPHRGGPRASPPRRRGRASSEAVRERDEPFGDFGLDVRADPEDTLPPPMATADPPRSRRRRPRLAPRQLPRRPGDRAAGDRRRRTPGPDRRRRAPPPPGRLRPRRRLDRARRLGRRLADLPQHPAGPRLHDDRDEAERLRRRASSATS